MGEAEVLVGGEHSAGQQVGLAHVVEEATHVAVETGVDAVQVLWLEEETRMRRLLPSFVLSSHLPPKPPSLPLLPCFLTLSSRLKR